MRNDKDNTRRIGGLILDLLMLSFIISFSLADVKITDGTSDSILSIRTPPEDHIIVSSFHSLFGSFLNHISKVQPHTSQALGAIFDFPRAGEVKRIVLADTRYSSNASDTNTKINAP